jgi:glycosyltransferase involved in cell wall biosynthesis
MVTGKKILIVAHYFSPMNSTGARRPEALASFLARKGIPVIVLTTKKKIRAQKSHFVQNVKVIECALLSTLVYESISENNFMPESRGVIYSFLKKFKQKVVNRYFGQIFDPRLPFVFYVALKIALNRISSGKLFKWVNNFADADILVSTSPPWTTHLLGLFIARILHIPFVVDYRDQFSSNHMFSQKLGWIETNLDKLFCNQSSLVSVVSNPMKEYYESLSCSKVVTVMNGYDERHFDCINSDVYLNRTLGDDKITVRYFGTITADRLMEPLWSALVGSSLSTLYRFEFYGDSSLLQNYLSKNSISQILDVQFFKSLPHKEAINLMRSSDALLFTETSEAKHASQRGVLTTKLFEYLASCRPLIAIIDNKTIAGELISQSGLAITLSIDEITIGKDLGRFPGLHLIHPDAKFISQYSRENQFSILLEEIDTI